MQPGFGLVTCQLHPNDRDRGPGTVYDEAVQLARLCEYAGPPSGAAGRGGLPGPSGAPGVGIRLGRTGKAVGPGARDLQWYVRWKYDDLAARPEPSIAAPPPPPLDPATERRLRARAIVGRPEEVARSLALLADIVGPSGQVVARACYPGLPWDIQRRQVELLGEIAPLVRDHR